MIEKVLRTAGVVRCLLPDFETGVGIKLSFGWVLRLANCEILPLLFAPKLTASLTISSLLSVSAARTSEKCCSSFKPAAAELAPAEEDVDPSKGDRTFEDHDRKP